MQPALQGGGTRTPLPLITGLTQTPVTTFGQADNLKAVQHRNAQNECGVTTSRPDDAIHGPIFEQLQYAAESTVEGVKRKRATETWLLYQHV